MGKKKRKYLGENRVGSYVDGDHLHPMGPVVHSPSTSSTISDPSYEEPMKLSPGYGHNETFNTNVIMRHYKGDLETESPIEAYNRAKFKELAETESIGSYLSMASVKSFPR